MLSINFLQFSDCPTAPQALKIVRASLDHASVQAEVTVIDITSEEEVQRHRFLGSPTIQINGHDIETSRRGDIPANGCRIYDTPDGPSGVPDESLIMDAIKRATGPRCKILFLCTGNSCRSQMAEGWARRLKGDVIEAVSAGTIPAGVNPRAVAVMGEAGVDITAQQSKHVAEFLDTGIDYVVTLCGSAAETCPVFPGNTVHVHRGFDDPPHLAEGAASEEEALGHYRRVRDEIRAFVEGLPDSIKDAPQPLLFEV